MLHRLRNLWYLWPALLLSAYAISPVMRESDQASILAGIVEITEGASITSNDSYNYDKLFFSYWLSAAVLKLTGWCAEGSPSAPSLLLITNALSWAVFWIGAIALAWRNPAQSRFTRVLAFTALIAPAMLLHMPVFAVAMISAGLLCVLAIVLQMRSPAWSTGLAFVVAFCATGARADALFALPAIAWLTSPNLNLRGVLARPAVYATALGGLAAFLVGRQLFPLEPFQGGIVGIRWRITAAFTVFGFGFGLLAVLLLYWAHLVRLWRSRSWVRRLLPLAGVSALLIPLAYYLVQLHSPRYFVQPLLFVFIAVHVSLGRNLLSSTFGLWRSRVPRWVSVAAILLLVGAILPLVIGVRAPMLTRPHPTLNDPTLFPTADGYWPMGANLSFLHTIRAANEVAIDHNQRTWFGSLEIEPESFSEEEPVLVLDTPVARYIVLAVALQGRQADMLIPFDDRLSKTPFLSDAPSLWERWYTGARFYLPWSPNAQHLVTGEIEPITPLDVDVPFFRLSSSELTGPRLTRSDVSIFYFHRLQLGAVFGGERYRFIEDDSDWAIARKHGLDLGWSSEWPFSVNAIREDGEIVRIDGKLTRDPSRFVPSFYHIRIPYAVHRNAVRFEVDSRENQIVLNGMMTIPQYMQVR